MSWIPLQDSGIAFEVVGLTEEVEFTAGSIFRTFSESPLSSFNGHVEFSIPDGVGVRVTPESYETQWGGNAQIWSTGENEWTPEPVTDDSATLGIVSTSFTSAGAGLVFDNEGDRSGSIFNFLIEVEEADPPPVPPTCDEIGPVSKANVSAFNPMRVHGVRLFAGAKRCLIANFNGAITAGRTIAEAKWQADGGWSTAMTGGTIGVNGRETTVTIEAIQGPGCTTIQCTATLDNGERYSQLFVVEVGYTPFQASGQFPTGQTTIVVTP